LESFFDAYPALRRYLSYYKNFILNNGVAVSILGRVRIFEEVFGDNEEAKAKALRAGCNHLIQSTASDMMLICLMVIEACMRNEGLESILVSTVHDSLVIDAMRHELPSVHGIVNEVLNNIPGVMTAVFGDNYDTSWCIVPFSGTTEVGLNMLDTRPIPSGTVDWDALLA
jgi:DNA polymerase-1